MTAGAQNGTPGHRAQTWFVGGDDLNVGGKVGHPDFAQLFEPDSAWATGYRNIDVFQMRPPWVLRTDKQELHKAYAFLAQHHIQVAING